MNTFGIEIVLKLAEATDSQTFFTYDEAVPLEAALLARLSEVPAGGLIVVDFENVRMASEAARQLLRRAIMRIANGELYDRFVVLAHLERCRYSLDAMLRKEQLTAVERTAGGPKLVGQAEGVAKETFDFVASLESATAKMVFEHFALQGIAAATNRLTNLVRLGVVRRRGPFPLPSGGREYLYDAVQ